MWCTNIMLEEENGSFDKNYPLTLDLLTIPGRGNQPSFCCSESNHGQVIGFDIGKNFGSLIVGHHNCHHGSCPVCYRHWLLSETLYAIAYLEAAKAAHPGSEIYQLRFFFRKQEGITLNDISNTFKSLNLLCKSPGVFGGISILHNIQVKKFVEDRITQCYERDYEEPLTRTKMYWAATDLDYLHHIGFYNFHDWREAVDLFWHIHVFVVADHYPTELHLHGNMKKSAAQFLHGGPDNEISFNVTDNNCKSLPTHRQDGSPCHWHPAKVKDHTDPYEGADLARSLNYCFSHCTLSAFPSLTLKALHRFGECYKNKLDFKHDLPWTGEAFRLDLTTGEETLTLVEKFPDSHVTAAIETLKQAYPHIHRRGQFVYPGDERAPPFNEALPRKTPYKPPITELNIKIFKLRTTYHNGALIPADGAEFTYKRRDEFITIIRLAEEKGCIPAFPVKLSTSIENAFKTWDSRCLNPKLRGKDKLSYSSDFEGYEDFEKAGRIINKGFISKATAYKPPDSLEFDKFKALEVAFYASLDSDNFLEDFTNAMEDLVPRFANIRYHSEEPETLTTPKKSAKPHTTKPQKRLKKLSGDRKQDRLSSFDYNEEDYGDVPGVEVFTGPGSGEKIAALLRKEGY